MNVGVIGAGAWGTALAILCQKAGNSVVLWSYSGNTYNFENVIIDKTIKITKEMSDLTNCDVWLIATPAAFFREIIKKSRLFYQNQPIIICTKGMEATSNLFMFEVLNNQLPECSDFGVLSGPQFAAGIANGAPSGATLSGNLRILEYGRVIFKNLYLEETDDIIGTSISGAGKNAIALIAGFNSIKAGENECAMMLTRGYAEIIVLGLALGAKIETFLGLCGIGDLFLSATSKTGRNYSAGALFANGEVPVGTIEGIGALKGLLDRAKLLGVKTPVLESFQKKIGL